MNIIHTTSRPDKMILNLAERADPVHSLNKSDSVQFIADSLGDLYANFESTAPDSLTAKLMYDPRSFRLDHMVTSAFAHGSWTHLAGNLFFFFAFAATIEILIGSIAFVFFTTFLAIATNISYSFAMFADVNALPTLGLSGVVMGMIGLFTFLLPTAKIRCFFWFIIIVRVFSIPAWILAAWYIGWDLYSLYFDTGQSNTNFVAHISGAVTGVMAGFFLFKTSKHRIKLAKKLQRV
ncbi:MAG: rhomboid family intramembrane serine protease [Thiohalomonadales bacterium]